ncbi:unknown protein [Oryza sativa Japonica Group]|uniref:Os01g0679400 protein n=1 Tax=Oryza sativa subsp. japonica TaxID=39947 RepID=Q5QM67_ORYSJ|nr:unknown protein [Oryza sativa Japonica Group]BAH91234.1 Os01g0679400 [Oryza sativa Japonica Group]|eukprot:NP_001172504.1 Os01g0679400 [Oryza sativa Japonica Group]
MIHPLSRGARKQGQGGICTAQPARSGRPGGAAVCRCEGVRDKSSFAARAAGSVCLLVGGGALCA